MRRISILFHRTLKKADSIQLSRKTNIHQSISDEIPSQAIISLFQVHFNSHLTFSPFNISYRMDYFLSHHYIIISDLSSRHETTLINRD